MLLQALLIVVLSALFVVSPGHACSRRSLENEFDASKAVFVGYVEKTNVLEKPNVSNSYVTRVANTFALVEIFKGTPPTDHTVKSMYPSWKCEEPLLVAGFYYIFYMINDNDFVAQGAFGTKLEYKQYYERLLLKREQELDQLLTRKK